MSIQDIHPDDREAMERQHGAISDQINDMLIPFQDAAYKDGLQRGLEQGKDQRDELLAAAKQALAECVDLISTPAGDALKVAIAKVEGGAT